MSRRLPRLLLIKDGKVIGEAIFVRGDKFTLDMTFTSLKKPFNISDNTIFNQLIWVLVRSLEEKDLPVANGSGTILDDGSTALRGKAEIVIDLAGVGDDVIEDEELMVIEFTFIDDTGNQMTVGQFEVPVRQDAQ